MKYIKYDEHGKQVSSKETKISEKDLPNSVTAETQLNIVESLAKKRTIRGLIAGLVLGVPVGAFAELIRLISSKPWDDFFIGIVVFLITVILSTAIGYISGSLKDRE